MKISIKNINVRIPASIRKNPFLNKLLSVLYVFVLVFDKSTRHEIVENIRIYKKQGYSGCWLSLFFDMLSSYMLYFITPYEYRCFDFVSRTVTQREDYFSLYELWDTFHSKEYKKFPSGKYNIYKLFSPYFLRDVIFITNHKEKTNKDIYNKFQELHKFAIAKPHVGKKGEGVKLINIDNVDYETLSGKLQKDYLLEEVIEQGEELAKFHPSSINTIRIVSALNSQGTFKVLFSLFRTGCDGSVVDNVGSGGIISMVEDGCVTSNGLRSGLYLERHPTTKIVFKGAVIPEWEKLIALTESAHRSQPSQRIVGWDWAWSDKGWDLVEANPTPSFASYQILSQKGIRPILKEYQIL